MSKEKETDAAKVLSQMSQLVGVPSFDLSSNLSTSHDVILEADTIGATCTLQPSSIDSDILFPLSSHSLTSGRKVSQDPYIAFDDADHPYAANFAETNTFLSCKQKPKDGNETPLSSVSTYFPTTSSNNDLTCVTCSKQFKSHHHLLVHQQFHNGRKPHSCIICTKSFTTTSDLKRHTKIHSKDSTKMFKCEECGKEFRDQASKTRHIKIHNKDSVLKCDLCSKEFSRTDSYKSHMKTHLDKKPYQCDVCLSEFTYKSSFNRHMLSHDSESLFICDICGKTFRRADYVDSHKKIIHLKNTEKLVHPPDKDGLQTKTDCLDDPVAASNPLLNKKEKNEPSKEKRKRRAKSNKNINAIPILMSMAENAAKPKKHKNTETSELIDSELISQEGSNDMQSPNIGNDLIEFFYEISDDDVIDSDCADDSDNLEIISSDDCSVIEEDNGHRVSCIVLNRSNESTI